MRILFTVIPAAGHLNPTIPIAQALQARGHDILYATGAEKVPLLKQEGLPVRTILEGQTNTMAQVFEPISDHLDRYNPYSIYRELKYLLQLMQRILSELEQLAADWQPDLIVADFCTPVGAALARKRQIPWVTTTQTPACIRPINGTPSNLGGLSRPRHLGHHLRDGVGRLLLETVRASISALFHRQWRQLGLALNGPGKSDGLYSPHAILSMLPWEIEYPRQWPAQLHMIGPIFWSDAPSLSPEVYQFLQSPRPAILVTMGTHLEMVNANFLPKLIQMLQTLPYRFIVGLGDITHNKNDYANNIEGIFFTPYISYNEILERVAAVIHHGGAGIMCHCLAAGRPAIVIPQGFDQPDNAQRVVEAGAGLRLNPGQVTPDRLGRALQDILEKPTFRQQTSAIAKAIYQKYAPIEAAVAIIEQVGHTQAPCYRNELVNTNHYPPVNLP